MKPTEQALLKSLEQNFIHARKQHELFERYSYVIVFSHAAIVGVVIKSDKNVTDYWIAFVFLLIVALMVYSSHLKWSAEFMNHMSAVLKISEKLDLIQTLSSKKNPQKIKNLLPFGEYIGYMALPLKIPLYVSMSASMIILDITIIAVDVWIVSFSCVTQISSQLRNDGVLFTSESISTTLAALCFLFFLCFAYNIRRIAKNQVVERYYFVE